MPVSARAPARARRLVTTGLLALVAVATGPVGMGAADPSAPKVKPPFDARLCAGHILTQAVDGTIQGCLIVDQLEPGDYTVALTTIVGDDRDPTFPGASITSLVPASGPPGTVVTIEGTAPVAEGPDPPSPLATVCWSGCKDGVSEVLHDVEWSTGRRFRLHAAVPAAPWLSLAGARPLVPGRYDIEVRCVGGSGPQGCPTAKATFDLTGPPSPRCAGAAPCGELRFTPPDPRPGDIVRIEGWAPLVRRSRDIPGFLLPITPGRPEHPGLTVRPWPEDPEAREIVVAPTMLTVRPPVSWTELGSISPVLIQPRGGFHLRLAADPANLRLLAHCSGAAIRFTRDGGQTWEEIPTSGVDDVLVREGEAATASCLQAIADPTAKESFYLAMATYRYDSGAPPDWLSGFQTTDGGRTWTRVTAPPGAPEEEFGGFRVHGEVVQALFSADRRFPGAGIVRETTDGGRTWRPGAERCPGKGACVRWGPEAWGHCGGADLEQSIRYSADGGSTFHTPDWPADVNPCWPQSLVGPKDGSVLLVDGNEVDEEAYPLRISRDGGRTWSVVWLPALPGTEPEDGAGRLFPGIGMLPDGRLLAFWPEGGRGRLAYLLAPGAGEWCTASGLPVSHPFDFQAVGDEIWWLEEQRAGTGGPVVRARHMSKEAVTCR